MTSSTSGRLRKCKALNDADVLLPQRRRVTLKWCLSFFSIEKLYVMGFPFFITDYDWSFRLSRQDTTWTIGNTPEYTVRRKGAKQWSAEDTGAAHCNSVKELSFGSTQLAPRACVRECAVTAIHTEWLCR